MSEVVDISPVIVHFELEMGSTAELTFVLTDQNSAPINLSGDTVTFSAWKDMRGTEAIATKSNGPGEHQSAADGETRFVLTPGDTDTGKTSTTKWHYAVRRHFDGKEMVWFKGELRIHPAVDDGM